MMLVASSGSPEAFMATCLLIALGSAAASAAGGASMATGAFIAGLLLAETEYRRAVEATVEPFKGLLLGLFFVSVGASLDWPLALAQPLTILALVVAMLIGKGAVAFAAARFYGLRSAPAGDLAAHIAPVGEFAFVALGAAVAAGVVGASSAATLNVAVALTMAILPFLSMATRRIQAGFRRASRP